MLTMKQAHFKMGDIFGDFFSLLPGAIDVGGDIYTKRIEADIAEDNKDRAEAIKAAEDAKRRAAEAAAGGLSQYQTPLIIGAVGLGLIGILIAVLKK